MGGNNVNFRDKKIKKLTFTKWKRVEKLLKIEFNSEPVDRDNENT